MTSLYSSKRSDEIKRKQRKEKSKEKSKIKITDEITCMECGKFSGWTNDDMRYVSGDKEIKCTNCGKPCIQTLCRKIDISNFGHEKK